MLGSSSGHSTNVLGGGAARNTLVERPPARKQEKEKRIMSNKSSNQPVVPSAREALDKFKMEAAQEVDVPSTYYENTTDEQ